MSAQHERVAGEMLEWAKEEHAPALEEGLAVTALDRLCSHGSRWQELFLSWVVSDFLPADAGPPLATRYAEREDLTPEARDIASRIAGARLGVHRVRAVLPGVWIELDSLEGGASVRAMSPRVSAGTRPGHFLLGRVMAGPPEPSLWGPVRLFPGGVERKWRAEIGAVGDRQPEASLELLRFEPDDHAEPLPDALVPLAASWAFEDDELVLETLEATPWVGSLGLEIGAGEAAWAFAWLANEAHIGVQDREAEVDLGGWREDDGRVELARLVVGRDRLTVKAPSAVVLEQIRRHVEEVLGRVVRPVIPEVLLRPAA